VNTRNGKNLSDGHAAQSGMKLAIASCIIHYLQVETARRALARIADNP
jgi:hypothetical protein